jgi:hypothetical protein
MALPSPPPQLLGATIGPQWSTAAPALVYPTAETADIELHYDCSG